MRTLACFIKTFKENIRDWKILILAIVFAPFFVYLMYFYMGTPAAAGYRLVLVNNDGPQTFSSELIAQWTKLANAGGVPVLRITHTTDTADAKKMIKNKEADILIIIPEDFSESYDRFLSDSTGSISPLINYGDPSNARYMLAASFIDYITFMYIGVKTGTGVPFDVKYQFAGVTRKLSEFDLYIPALLVLSVIMMLFTAGASIVREVEKDTITRLSLSKVSSGEFMLAMSINQVIIGMICLFLTLLAAFSVGYKTSGSVALMLLVGALTCFSVISISIITASFIRTMFGLLTLGCFPFFILMFFSDCMIPLPKINLFEVAGNHLYLNDILPTATATRALNKIMNYNSGLGDISFELIWISLLSVVYFIMGIRLFRRKYGY
jgi:ABC-2 type transport system permease protein